MSIRLQILLAEEELQEIKRLAAQEHMTVSAWVRRAIQHEQRERPRSVVQGKQEVIRKAAEFQFPTADYADIAADIESDYLEGLPH